MLDHGYLVVHGLCGQGKEGRMGLFHVSEGKSWKVRETSSGQVGRGGGHFRDACNHQRSKISLIL